MSGSRIALRQARSHARLRGRNDINIVPMLDVMVILIFFLIFTAVFSKMNILELNLPLEGGPPPELPAVLELEVIVRSNAIEVADRNTGPAPEKGCRTWRTTWISRGSPTTCAGGQVSVSRTRQGRDGAA